MIGSYFIGIVGIVSMTIIWIGVQSAWKNVFKDQTLDVDALGDRTKCTNCHCTTGCTQKRTETKK